VSRAATGRRSGPSFDGGFVDELKGLYGSAAGGGVRRWTGGAINHVGGQSGPPGGFTATYPRRSLTLFVIPA